MSRINRKCAVLAKTEEGDGAPKGASPQGQGVRPCSSPPESRPPSSSSPPTRTVSVTSQAGRASIQYKRSEPKRNLRDASRTERPIVTQDAVSGDFSPILGERRNVLQFDWLVSYRPTPGTVVFVGYGSTVTEPATYRFSDFTRLSDGFFLKLSYRYRV